VDKISSHINFDTLYYYVKECKNEMKISTYNLQLLWSTITAFAHLTLTSFYFYIAYVANILSNHYVLCIWGKFYCFKSKLYT